MGKTPRLTIVLAGTRLFCLRMLALLLSLPSDSGVGAVTFTFNGFQENSLYVVSDSSWFFDTATDCFKFDPAAATWGTSIPGRFLYPVAVQMIDPGSTTVKSFSTSFIYQLQIQYDNSATGPGMAFILVPDNVTIGAPLDFMGLVTNRTSATPKNNESDSHTLGVELDTYMNLEFNDPNENHIGINLASMNSTYTIKPVYSLASGSTDLYQQIWIDYFEADSRMDIYYANYTQGKPSKPQGSKSGLDLSLLKETMHIGFSTAKGIESSNVPYVCAWSFSNDGILAPPIVLAQDATPDGPVPAPSLSPRAPIPSPPPVPIQSPATGPPQVPPLPSPSPNFPSPNQSAPPPLPTPSPAPDGPVAAPSLPPPAPIPNPPPVPTRSPAPGISNPPPPPASNPPPLRAPNPSAFSPANPPPFNRANPLPPSSVPPQGPSSDPPTTAKIAGKKLDLAKLLQVILSLVGVFVVLFIIICHYWLRFLSHPLRIFISHAGGPDGSEKNFPIFLHDRMKRYTWSISKLNVRFFFDKENIDYGELFARKNLDELARFGVGLVVVTEAFFRRKWPMTELIAFVEAQMNDPTGRLRVLPLFYKLTPEDIRHHLRQKTWEPDWEEMSQGDHPLEAEKCREAVKWLCSSRGILYRSEKRDHDKEYIEEICKGLDKILRKDKSLVSYRWRASLRTFRIPSECRPRMAGVHESEMVSP